MKRFITISIFPVISVLFSDSRAFVKESYVVSNDKLRIYSGKTGLESIWSGDIWTMSKRMR
jgi:hypothetical protein